MQGAHDLTPMFCPNCGWTGPLAAADLYEGVDHCPRCIGEPLRVSRGLAPDVEHAGQVAPPASHL